MLWKWILDRLKERSSKTFIILIVSALAGMGIIPSESPDKVVKVIEDGQVAYHEAADSVAAAIEVGKDLVETGRETVTYVRDTGRALWGKIYAFVVGLIALFGFSSKDSRNGQHYSERELTLSSALSKNGHDPRDFLPDAIVVEKRE